MYQHTKLNVPTANKDNVINTPDENPQSHAQGNQHQEKHTSASTNIFERNEEINKLKAQIKILKDENEARIDTLNMENHKLRSDLELAIKDLKQYDDMISALRQKTESLESKFNQMDKELKEKAEGHTFKCDQCNKLEKRITDFESLYNQSNYRRSQEKGKIFQHSYGSLPKCSLSSIWCED